MTERSSSQTIVRDFLNQVGGLLYYRFVNEKEIQIHDPNSENIPPEITKFIHFAQEMHNRKLSLVTLGKQLKTLQKKVIFSSDKYLELILTTLSPFLSINIEELGPKKNKKKSQKKKMKNIMKNLPSSTDRLETLEDRRDKTPEFYVLETFVKCFENLEEKKLKQKLEEIEENIILDFFNLLVITRTPAIRFMAGECIRILSTVDNHFEYIINLFSQHLSRKLKKNMQRSIVTYERAVKILDFSLRKPKRAEISIKFVDLYSNIIKKIDRGVRKMEICKTLPIMFGKLLPNSSQVLKNRKKKKKRIIKKITRKKFPYCRNFI
ncbi:hypothetical protein M0812_18799 [Anaeramoeba flamelloides]|uniref:Uncharacterized protein n=1 Tax=Anaeramoeba flamelloides TaxID=1746091 RepID=A0AAV7ZAL5_9EUKA|nr:hypothetical protein M0812_18799 [Anaeramoeba flamelloides]